MGDEVTTEEVQPPEKDEAVEGKEQEKDEITDVKEPVVKQKRVACKKVACEKCGRSYSVRRLDDHKCVPPTFHEEPVIEKTPLPPESDKPPVINVVREPTIDDLTTDVISELIRRERETKRAAKRERWAKHLV